MILQHVWLHVWYGWLISRQVFDHKVVLRYAHQTAGKMSVAALFKRRCTNVAAPFIYYMLMNFFCLYVLSELCDCSTSICVWGIGRNTNCCLFRQHLYLSDLMAGKWLLVALVVLSIIATCQEMVKTLKFCATSIYNWFHGRQMNICGDGNNSYYCSLSRSGSKFKFLCNKDMAYGNCNHDDT